ncbi:MAG: polysaccharide deacetylase family protein [Patescibacteria group bacterium]
MQPENKGFRLGRLLVIIAILAVLYLIGRAIFGSPAEIESNIPDITNENVNTEAAANTNDNGNSNVNTAVNSNSNANTNSNSNINAAITSDFNLENCKNNIAHGSTAEKRISLTFNVGTVKEGEIQKVLDALKSTSTPADFFARGDVAEANPDLINKIASAGFPIYNLSYDHPRFTELTSEEMADELEKADAAISQRTEKSTKPFFRPPYGAVDDDVLAAVKEDGYCPVTWTVDALDWSADYTAAQSKERVLTNISNGSIVLMQASNSVTSEIVPELITNLKSQGYEIVDLNKLLE